MAVPLFDPSSYEGQDRISHIEKHVGQHATMLHGGSVPTPRAFQIPAVYYHSEDPTTGVKAALRNGYTFIFASELTNALAGSSLASIPPKSCMLFYDDGHMLQYRTIHPLIQGLGVKANLGIVPDFIDGNTVDSTLSTFLGASFTASTTNGSTSLAFVSNFTNLVQGTIIQGSGIPANTTITSTNSGASTLVMSNPATATASVSITGPGTPMTWAQAQEMVSTGLWEVQNHTKTHALLDAQTSSDRVSDLNSASSRIQSQIGVRPTAVIYPQGHYDAGVTNDVNSTGHSLGFTTSNFLAGVLEPTVLPSDGTYEINRDGRTPTPRWIDSRYSEIVHSWINDTSAGMNNLNARAWWLTITGATFTSGGRDVVLNSSAVGTAQDLLSDDAFRVIPGSRIYYRFYGTVTGLTAGTCGVYLHQYSGLRSDVKVLISDLTLKSFSANQTRTLYEGEVTVDATCKWVRMSLQADATCDGILTYSTGLIRPMQLQW